MLIKEIFIVGLAAIGVFFILVSAIGILRLPDVFARMHAAGKAGTLGVSCLLLSGGLYHGGSILVRMMVLIVLYFITAPIATTAMARASYRNQAVHFELNYDDMQERH